MSFRHDFITWYNNEFKTTQLYKDMADTVEGSPWHRENSVAIHTDMVVSQYISWVNKDWDINVLVGAVACAFHDTGKPSARVVKFKPERGQYNSFGGHEIISARLWEDYAVKNAERMQLLFGADSMDAYYDLIYKVGFVIEHHMPYEQGSDKIQDMATTSAKLFGYVDKDGFNTQPIFQNHLMADTVGRIADDHSKKIQAVQNWIFEFDKKTFKPFRSDDVIHPQKTVIVPIGPSGCGKSTLLKTLRKYHGDHIEHYSWDNLRLEWYSPDYDKAYKMSTEDSHFRARYMKVFNDLILAGKTIYVDNTNLSRKRRRPWIDAARKHGYNVIGYVFPTTSDIVISRQKTRGDKSVPADAVLGHYMSLQGPLYGEFDAINVINTNRE